MLSSADRYRELLLVLLALCAERPVGRDDLAAGLTRRVGRDYRPSLERVQCAIGALVAEGLIESEARDGEVFYRTTASGVEALDERAETRIDTFLFTDVVGSTALLDRLGDHIAHVVREQDDFFGRPVIVARRLCDVARGGQIVLSETVRRLAGSPTAHAFEPLGALALKGLNDPVSATALRPAATSSTVRGSLSNEQQWRAHTKRSAAENIGVAVA
jgi:class 3 adenylate cyclase